MLVLDVDGTLTDGGMYYSEQGDEFKRFNSRDGMAIRRLCRGGFQVAFLSGGLGRQMAQRRAEMLAVQHCYVGERPKPETLAEWREALGISWEEIAYIGDDVNDLAVMSMVGFSACPNDAMDVVKAEVDVVLDKRGGDACVREFIDRFLYEEAWGTSKPAVTSDSDKA
jgi:YrbI family 3-deoxy-D-manno-octulosonate 8-phosphate phosphatase